MKPIKLILAILFTGLFAGTSFSQGLNSITSPDFAHVIAVGDNGNMLRSTNGGTSWAKYTVAGFNMKYVTSFALNVWIAADNGTVLSGTIGSTVLVPQLTGSVNTLNSVYFSDNFNGHVCGNNGTVYRTTNGGTIWTPAAGTIPNTVNLNSIAFRSSTEGVVVGNGGKYYKTTNGGTTWTEIPTGTTQNLNKVVYGTDGAAIVGNNGTMLIHPESGSVTAVNMKIRSDITALTGIQETLEILSRLTVAGGGGFIRNNRNNNNKFLNFEMNPMFDNIVDIKYIDNNTGYAVSSVSNAIIKTTNAGTSWALTGGATISFAWQQKLTASGGIGNGICQHPYNNNTVFCGYGNKIYVSRNRGENWTQISTVTSGGSSMHSFYVSPVDTNIWLSALESGPDYIARTTDYGVTWTNVLAKNFSNYGQPLEMDWNNPSTFYFAPDNGGYWKSTNSGLNWTEISGNYPFRSPCDIVIMADSSNVQFVADGITGSGFAQIFKSTNSGVNWTLVHTNTASGSGSEIPSIAISQLNRAVMYCTEWSGSNIYKTTNYGANWAVDHTNGFSGWASDICHDDPTVIMTGNYGASSSLSYNNGTSFANLPSMSGAGAGAGMLAIDKSLMLSQQTSNLYKLKVTYSVITSVDEHINISSLPQDYSLSQNYPNPFNPSTTINFALPKEGMVSLKVYNQLGQVVETLAEGFRQAGNYSINYDASKLSSGIYFYKLSTSQGFVETKKMLLVK